MCVCVCMCVFMGRPLLSSLKDSLCLASSRTTQRNWAGFALDTSFLEATPGLISDSVVDCDESQLHGLLDFNSQSVV